MKIAVYIPSTLRQYAEHKERIVVEAETVKEALDELTKNYPQLTRYIMDDNGQLRHFVNIFLNDRDIRSLKGLDTPLNENDRLLILPAIAGGYS